MDMFLLPLLYIYAYPIWCKTAFLTAKEDSNCYEGRPTLHCCDTAPIGGDFRHHLRLAWDVCWHSSHHGRTSLPSLTGTVFLQTSQVLQGDPSVQPFFSFRILLAEEHHDWVSRGLLCHGHHLLRYHRRVDEARVPQHDWTRCQLPHFPPADQHTCQALWTYKYRMFRSHFPHWRHPLQQDLRTGKGLPILFT